MESEVLVKNQKAWNSAAPFFKGGGALSIWGALAEGEKDPEIIGEIEGKTFLEIACGSGHSLKYLAERGAKKIYGIDFSEAQIGFANELNTDLINTRRIELFHSTMEDRVAITENSIDTVFSIYGIGWTQNLEKTLSNIYGYLKPGGKLICSFENPLFTRAIFDEQNDSFTFTGSPYEDYIKHLDDWFGGSATVIVRLPSTWISTALKIGFELVEYKEIVPVRHATNDPELIKYYNWEKAEKIALQ